jgi:hypothetical protein
MQQNVVCKKSRNFEELFSESVSDIALELDGLKAKAMKNDFVGLHEHIARINNSLIGLMSSQIRASLKIQDI